jgi:ABC-type glycerol-3-phosphate transport system substrate-binding protein
MKQLVKLAAAAAVGAIACGSVVYAQAAAPPPRAIVTLYHAAPGQQEGLLRWLAEQDRVARAAGVAPVQLYVHTDGDSWDYMGIAPVTTEAQDEAMDAAAKKLGVTSGPRVSLELRKYIASHTDTYAIGPISPEQAVAALGSR